VLNLGVGLESGLFKIDSSGLWSVTKSNSLQKRYSIKYSHPNTSARASAQTDYTAFQLVTNFYDHMLPPFPHESLFEAKQHPSHMDLHLLSLWF